MFQSEVSNLSLNSSQDGSSLGDESLPNDELPQDNEPLPEEDEPLPAPQVSGLDDWQTTTPLTFSSGGAHDSASFAANGYMYLTGGQYGGDPPTDLIQRAPIHEDGSLGAWTDMASLPDSTTLPMPVQDHTALLYQPSNSPNPFVYVVGGWSGTALTEVFFAPIYADGTLGTWNQGPSLNVKRHGHAATIVDNKMYTIGGWSSSYGALANVEYVDIKPDGSLSGNGSKWHTTTALPQPISYSASASGTMDSQPVGPWVLGGESPPACPKTVLDSVYKGVDGGSDLSWQWQAAGNLPEPLYDTAAVFIDSLIIITGGAFRGYPPSATECPWKDGTFRDTVYLGSVDSQGDLISWSEGPTLPSPRGDHSLVLTKDYLYILGGRSVSLYPPYPSEVWYARLLKQ